MSSADDEIPAEPPAVEPEDAAAEPGSGTAARPRRTPGRLDAQRKKGTRVLAITLAQAVGIVRWPLLALLVAPVPPILVLAATAPAVGGSDTWVFGGLALIGALVVVAFGVRRRRYIDAVKDREVLADQLYTITEPGLVPLEAVEQMRRVAEVAGLFLIRRLRAVWVLLRFPDHLMDQVKEFDRARWFLPPTIGVSWLILMAQVWLTILSWPLTIVAMVAWGAGIIGS